MALRLLLVRASEVMDGQPRVWTTDDDRPVEVFEQVGFYWGGTPLARGGWRRSDPMHYQLASGRY